MKYSSDIGRYVVARDPVSAGETLANEEAFAAALYPEKFGINCQNCFGRLKNAVPCQECSGVAYCSVACRDAANASFHKYVA